MKTLVLAALALALTLTLTSISLAENVGKFGIDWEKELYEYKKSLILETDLSLGDEVYHVQTRRGKGYTKLFVEVYLDDEKVFEQRYYIDINPDKAHKIEVQRIRDLLFEDNLSRQ